MSRILSLFLVVMSFLMNEPISLELSKENLFSAPSFISAKSSPDGDYIASVGADPSGITNVFLTKRGDAASERTQISFFKTPEIIQFFWSPHSDKILLLKDEDGTGGLHLHGINIHSREQRVYTEKFSIPSSVEKVTFNKVGAPDLQQAKPLSKQSMCKHMGDTDSCEGGDAGAVKSDFFNRTRYKISTKMIQIGSQKNSVVIGLNDRNPQFHDLYVLDLDSGDLTLLFQNDTYARFLVSNNLELILKTKINEDGSWTFFTQEDQVFLQLTPEEAFHTECISYDENKRAVYLLDNRFSNTTQLLVKSIDAPYSEKILGFQPDSDIDEVLFIENEPKAYASYYTQKKWHVIDPVVEKDISFLENQIGTDFQIVNQSRDALIWILSTSIPDEGSSFWVYDRKNHNLSLLNSPTKHSFSKMYPLVVEARDGEKLVCYYTLPKEHDKGGYVETPIPLVVVPHGGPFKVRDKFEFNPYHQWLASCGYAVLSVNFRLSSGFGKAFVNAGNGEWGGKAHFDVIDAIEHCVSSKITEKGKIAVFGGSYGGYEALAGLTFTPDYFVCCVAICAPSHLKTILDNVPLFWEFTSKPLSDHMMFFTKKAFILSMGGDPDEEEGIKALEKRSPLHFLESINAPLLLIHGQNDHIVTEKASQKIYESMKQNHKDVSYILFPDEGHRIAKFANKMVYLDHSERFLAQYLGGKYEPIKEDVVARSSAQISN